MARLFEPNSFSYPLNEDMSAAYRAKMALDNDPQSVIKRYKLKKAIYELCLTLKAACSTGDLREDVRCEVEEYFWGMLA